MDGSDGFIQQVYDEFAAFQKANDNPECWDEVVAFYEVVVRTGIGRAVFFVFFLLVVVVVAVAWYLPRGFGASESPATHMKACPCFPRSLFQRIRLKNMRVFYFFIFVFFLQDLLELHAPYNLWDCAKTLQAVNETQTVDFINVTTIPPGMADQNDDVSDG